jgi:outer membrane autotransporter protein
VAGLQLAQETVGAFQETGAGPLSLSVASETRESLATHLGVRVQRQFTTDKRDRFEVRTAWRHEFKGETNINASFAGSGGTLSVAGSAPEGDSFVLGGDLSASFSENISLLLAYDGDFGGNTFHRLHGGIRYRF